MSRLTTHVLDTARGCPAGGLRIELFRLSPERQYLGEAVTNSDGRCEAPLLEGDAFTGGDYELVFHAGDYLGRHHPAGDSGPFLGRVPIRFTVSRPGQHYHVPLLLSPFGYTTYRGS